MPRVPEGPMAGSLLVVHVHVRVKPGAEEAYGDW